MFFVTTTAPYGLVRYSTYASIIPDQVMHHFLQYFKTHHILWNLRRTRRREKTDSYSFTHQDRDNLIACFWDVSY